MTTATATYHTAPRFPWLLLFGLVLLAAVAGSVYTVANANRHHAVIFSAHAEAKHGSDAIAIRRSCDNGGELQRWQANENNRKFYRLCKFGNGRVGLQIIECTARGPRERSAFVPGKSQLPAGSLVRAIEYVSAKAAKVAIGGLCQ